MVVNEVSYYENYFGACTGLLMEVPTWGQKKISHHQPHYRGWQMAQITCQSVLFGSLNIWKWQVKKEWPSAGVSR